MPKLVLHKIDTTPPEPSKYILTKCSFSGWQKVFGSELDAREELRKHICYSCVEDYSPISIEDMLGTNCGYEFDYEEK